MPIRILIVSLILAALVAPLRPSADPGERASTVGDACRSTSRFTTVARR